MASKRTKSGVILSPIHPSLHFVLFLILALLLVMVVAGVLQKTAEQTRAYLMCPRPNKIEMANRLRECQYGITYTKDTNGCFVAVCKDAPLERKVTLPSAFPKGSLVPPPRYNQ